MRKIIFIILGIIAAIILIFAFKIKDFYDTIYKGKASNTVKTQEKKTQYNILLLGYGGGNHDGTYLTDSIMIMHIDTKNKRALLFSIPRDIWVSIPTKSGQAFNNKINSLYEMGLYPDNYPDLPDKFSDSKHPAELIKSVATQITGLSIDNYVAVDFDSFRKVIDSIGGIDVNVDKTFDDYEYPIDGKEKDLCGKDDQFKQIEQYLNPNLTDDEKKQEEDFLKDKPDLAKFLDDISNDPVTAFPCRYEHLHFNAGPTHLDGATALKFARSRHSLQDGTDFARGRRQQKVVLAVKDKVLSISFIPKIIPLMETLKDNIQTDMSVTDIKDLLGQSQQAKQYKISSLVLSDDNYLQNSVSADGQSILIEKNDGDNWQDIHTWIQNTLEGITPTPVATQSGTIKSKK